MFDRRGCRKYLNESERRLYFKATQIEKNRSRRLFCQTLLLTGCRISEALNLRVRNFDSSQKSLIFETLKRRKKGLFRAVPVPEDYVCAMMKQLSGKHASSRIWNFSRPTAYRMIIRRMLQAGISGSMKSPKGLRHGFAVACVISNIPLTTIQKWMGHARLETTAIYLGVSGEEERILASRLWP